MNSLLRLIFYIITVSSSEKFYKKPITISTMYDTCNILRNKINSIKNEYPDLQNEDYLNDKNFLNLKLVFSFGDLFSELYTRFYVKSEIMDDQKNYIDKFIESNEVFKKIEIGENCLDELLECCDKLYCFIIHISSAILDKENNLFCKIMGYLDNLLIFRDKIIARNEIYDFVDTSYELKNNYVKHFKEGCKKLKIQKTDGSLDNIKNKAIIMVRTYNNLKNIVNIKVRELDKNSEIDIKDMILDYDEVHDVDNNKKTNDNLLRNVIFVVIGIFILIMAIFLFLYLSKKGD